MTKKMSHSVCNSGDKNAPQSSDRSESRAERGGVSHRLIFVMRSLLCRRQHPGDGQAADENMIIRNGLDSPNPGSFSAIRA